MFPWGPELAKVCCEVAFRDLRLRATCGQLFPQGLFAGLFSSLSTDQLNVQTGSEVWTTATATGHIAGLLQNWWVREYAPFLLLRGSVLRRVHRCTVLWFPWRQVVELFSSSVWQDVDGLDEGFLADTHTDVLRLEAIPTEKHFHCPKRAVHAARGAARRRSSRANSVATTFLCPNVDGGHRTEAL